ncbi:MAG: TolC family protein [Epsilonproteobacteria bacterium]|nr:TolC family protein [Campylobacterota bacterium]OIO17199.1 MAG: transporter [Helicobacteraceae bacterium CG1_02_36_14]PIP11124.1 MAG: transporter [Sulfurimonas sp. CG23_combo_of_CG06-09_8_20_14_all_36_33]PIS24859.1 MAG: transporter [Sulfurimonas sp. CG08_land_8_20_14_0_20_36_33]PIU34565.1 MAG: transporter [Sulfurimonas sp. CG07_land_8_20_14_0_80_36_56]PIV04748.1 MAG: transporter [Sulfurimonas sp. CG03_land_8_20_14_0_80_36_25]PIV35040.1 MAG: transporter [Sulfurimonas sp. CG02_land_8_20_14_3
MKVLNISVALFLACSTLLSAAEKNEKLEEYISQNKKEQFSYDYQKNEAESSKLRDSWIAPLNLQYSYTVSNPYSAEQTSQNAAIKLDQPIFQSGGIYYAIKFAEVSHLYANYSVDAAKRKLVKDAISLLMQIKQLKLKIDKQNLQIKNAEINLELKKEQYLSGQLDSGFLDNAIIERNSVIQALYDIETTKERLISKFQAISDSSYESAQIPHLEVLDKESFLEYNILLNISKSDREKYRYTKNMTIAKYLPKVSITGGYNWSKSEKQLFSASDGERDYYDYGVKASMPLSINTFRDVESAKIDFLKSKLVIEDKKRELNALFEQVMQNIDNFDKKRVLSIENRDLYEKLLVDTKNLFTAGYKTKYDVDLLENSVEIQKLDVMIFDIDRQLELLTLYEMYINDKY